MIIYVDKAGFKTCNQNMTREDVENAGFNFQVPVI